MGGGEGQKVMCRATVEVYFGWVGGSIAWVIRGSKTESFVRRSRFFLLSALIYMYVGTDSSQFSTQVIPESMHYVVGDEMFPMFYFFENLLSSFKAVHSIYIPTQIQSLTIKSAK